MSDNKSYFTNEGVYKTETISKWPEETPKNYSDFLLNVRIDMARQYGQNGVALDLCCGNGRHLIRLAEVFRRGIGLDFSYPYVQKANEEKSIAAADDVTFICGDAMNLPFPEGYFDILYSFSSLYVIPRVDRVILEAGRVLKPGGTAILDLGNVYSLNHIVAESIANKAQHYHISPAKMKQFIRDAGLKIEQQRVFQILPMWTNQPGWMKPLLWSGWRRLLSHHVGGKMLDEWISSLPGLRELAFRHVFVCRKLH